MYMFGERLKRLRNETKLLQKDIAEHLNINVRTYQYYEASKLEPNLEKLVQLGDIFDVSLDYLLGRTDDRKLHK